VDTVGIADWRLSSRPELYLLMLKGLSGLQERQAGTSDFQQGKELIDVNPPKGNLCCRLRARFEGIGANLWF